MIVLQNIPSSCVYTLLQATLSEGLVHFTVHNHLRQLSVHLQSCALIFISELPGVILLSGFTPTVSLHLSELRAVCIQLDC